MIRPDDRHTFSATEPGITLVNIAFPLETLDFLRGRYFENSNLYFWTTSLLPFHIRLSQDLVKRLSSRAEEAMKYRRSRLQLDSLLLFIFRQITANQEFENNPEIPVWLYNAIQKYNCPEQFARGVEGFVELCDRNVDHVNRVVRMHFYKTLTELVNEFRMRYAVTQLSITAMPIKPSAATADSAIWATSTRYSGKSTTKRPANTANQPDDCLSGIPRTQPHPAPCTMHHASCTLHPASCILHPAPCTLLPASRFLLPASRGRATEEAGNGTTQTARPGYSGTGR